MAVYGVRVVSMFLSSSLSLALPVIAFIPLVRFLTRRVSRFYRVQRNYVSNASDNRRTKAKRKTHGLLPQQQVTFNVKTLAGNLLTVSRDGWCRAMRAYEAFIGTRRMLTLKVGIGGVNLLSGRWRSRSDVTCTSRRATFINF